MRSRPNWAAGVEVTVTDPTTKKRTILADSIAKYISYAKGNKRKKTWGAYANDLRYFADFCSEHRIKTVDELAEVKVFVRVSASSSIRWVGL